MSLGEDISLKVRMSVNQSRGISISVKLTISTILVFALMLFVSNYLIGQKQAEITEKLMQGVESRYHNTEQTDEMMVVIDEAQIRTTADYQLYMTIVACVTILLGGMIFFLLIHHHLRPLKQLMKKVDQINIDNVEDTRKDIAITDGSYEIRLLSSVLQSAFARIYEGYERQRKFSANVAHELRTPLAVLRTRIEVFRRNTHPMNTEIRGFVDTMENSVNRLSDLVEEILFLSKNHQVNRKEVSIREIIDEIMLDLENKAAEKSVVLSVSGADQVINTDDVLLERALYNLVDNAIKYNVNGGRCNIEIANRNGKTEICVSDTGVGLTPEDKRQAFDLFYQAGEARNRETKGHGIGLALVQDIVKKLDGEIIILDNQPKGSVFVIRL